MAGLRGKLEPSHIAVGDNVFLTPMADFTKSPKYSHWQYAILIRLVGDGSINFCNKVTRKHSQLQKPIEDRQVSTIDSQGLNRKVNYGILNKIGRICDVGDSHFFHFGDFSYFASER